MLLLSLLVVGTLPEGRRRGERAGNSLERREECPKLRVRRRGCSYRYECKEECTDKKDCKTTYQYKCKEYKKQVNFESGCPYFPTFSLCQFQECRNVWQNQCRGKNGRRRSKRSPRRQPYWLDKNNIEVIFNAQDFPVGPSDLPFADEGSNAGSTYSFASPPRSKSCWKQVRRCEWKTYRTSCGNRPTTTCTGKIIQDCKKRCRNRWYCDTCPAGTGGGGGAKPTTAKPVGPTQTTPRPRPTTARPRPPGPPAPPPPGTFIIGPPGTPVGADTGISVIDARSGKGRKKRRP